jgi:hypothetical protein
MDTSEYKMIKIPYMNPATKCGAASCRRESSIIKMHRQDIVSSLILAPIKSGLRGIPINIGIKPLRYYTLPVLDV